ncbi:iron-siderophore ABC transporter substrate-binding protein [Streptomyces sp. AM 2-1-1]|uniref:ABC transporter substrate-binding protein n=1 Tax=Streptomyces sp. AM 2-1-1 TaxID=3028709 RepID=UPI0023B9C386|nr:iron-siderophore ABC transporter substrate-binding protein [Streptomyces sp. AM 2-1-1]WEH38776.1 iron-siderophore ABC transporter substrate-binding protein [Streptomyces sp. AM 2-1-1]
MTPNQSTAPRRLARPLAAVAVLGICALTATACGSSDADSASDGSAKGGTTTVTDAAGTKVTVPAEPARVVVLSEMDLDSSLTLGVKPVGLTAGRGQKGAPAYLTDEAGDIPVVGAVTGPDIEKVVQAAPDVILAGQMTDTQVLAQLRKIAPTLVTIGDDKDWKKSLSLTGEVLGKANEADAFLADYDAKVAALKKDLGFRAGAKVSVARYSPQGSAVMQQGVFISDVLNDLGFTRPGIQAEKGEGHSTPISEENLDELDGDWLFIGTLTSTGGSGVVGRLSANPAYQQLGAVKAGHVTEIDGSMWTSLGGAKAAVNVLADLRKAMVK